MIRERQKVTVHELIREQMTIINYSYLYDIINFHFDFDTKFLINSHDQKLPSQISEISEPLMFRIRQQVTRASVPKVIRYDRRRFEYVTPNKKLQIS